MMRPFSRRHFVAGAAVLGTPAFAAMARLPRRMKAYEVGNPVNDLTLHMVERPVPQPGPGEVLLRVRATGLNARDLSLLRRVHIFGQPGDSEHRVPLDDNACEVAALGAGVSRVAVGDRVMVTHFPRWIDGAWDDDWMSKLDFSVNVDGFLTQYTVVGADGLVQIPAAFSDVEACTLPNAGLTAWHAVVVDAGVKPGETVVTLGSGGVSVFGLQLAKMQGARVIITSSSDDKLARLRQIGADETINYRTTPDWPKEVLRLTGGRGADVVLNTVGIGEMEHSILACGSNGRIALIGANPVRRGGGPQETVGLKDFPRGMIMKGLTIKATIVGSRRMLEDLSQAMAAHRLKPVVDRVFPFAQARDAVRYMESGEKIGKIVITVA